jgi:hypothetical protein
LQATRFGATRVRVVLLVALVAIGASRCSTPPAEPLQLDGNRLTVDNRSAQDWSSVEIQLNSYFRVTTPKIAAGSRFQAPLDIFVAGFGQRFDLKRMPIHSLTLTATLPDGQPLVLNKQFQESGLAGALGGKK